MSNAGRDTFLAQESDRALSEMVRCASEARAASALIACANHKSAHVRVKVASHLDELMEAACSGASGGRTPLANNWTTLERIFKTAAGFLDEGSLETRTYGKRIVWHIKSTVGNRTDFERLVMSVSPAPLQKKVVDVVEGSNGPPPPPSRGPGASRMVRSGSGAPPSPARALREQYSAGSGGGYVTAGMGGSNGLSAGPLSSAPLPTGRYAPASAPTQMGGSSSSASPGDAGRMGRRGSRGPARDGLDGIPESAAGTGAPGGAAGGRFLRSLSSSRQEITNGSMLPSFPAGAWPSAAGEALS